MPRKQRPRDEAQADDHDGGEHGAGERLQKVLAAAGVGSRRDCEELIREGRVEVDRQTVTELGTRVDPLRQEIRVDGEALRQPKRLYYVVNKPVGVVTTNHDPSGRTRVIDLVPTEERVFAVGRLDRSSEGLILVTNDGEFANRITHPRYGVEKTYLVRVAGAPNHQQLARLKKGVHLAEGYAKAQAISVKKQHGQSTDLVIVLNEGRNREIRRILARVGHKVLALKRIAIGPLKLADLGTGEWRRLMPAEIDALLAVAQEKRREAKSRKRSKPIRSASEGDVPRRVSEGKVARRASEGAPARSPGDDEPYVQKQALLSQPLSIDDLLRDDMEEGPLVVPNAPKEAGVDYEQAGGEQGGVIDYEAESSEGPEGSSAPPTPREIPRPQGKPVGGKRPPRSEGRGKRPFTRGEGGGERGERPYGKRKPFGRKPAGQRGRPSGRGERSEGRAEVEALPRESYGKKRGGRRVFSPPHDGRGPAAETGGNFEFRPKGTGRRGKTGDAKTGGRGRAGDKAAGGAGEGRGGGKRFGAKGGKPFGRKPGGKFGAGKRAGGKPFGRKPGGGGKRKGRQ